MTSHAQPIAMPPPFLCWSGLLLACSAGAAQEPGSRSFERQLALEDSAATSANVSIGDVNSDGHQDILLVKGRHWPLENLVLLGDGSGSFQPAYPVGLPDRSYSGVLVDMDRDGDLDLVVSNDNPDAKLVHLNDGNGRFTIGSMYGRPEWSTRHISVADLNNDSLPDVVLANRSGGDSGVSYICFGVEGGRFETECVGFARGSATTITPADFNNDGAVDLAVPHRDGGQSFIYLNDGQGGFEERVPFGPPTAAIRSAKAADLDGDGRLDLVVIDERSGPGILWGRMDGTYAPVERLGASQARPYSIAVADLDRNGRMDIIVGFVESRPVVYFNDAPEAFVPVPFGDNEGVAYGFAVGDLDEDGLLDIAMARSGAKNMVYFGSSPPAETLETIAARTVGSGAHQSSGGTTSRADEHTCLVLPGSWSNATRSFTIGSGEEFGRLRYVSEVSGGVWHQRAAVHPTGRYAYVAAWVEDGEPAPAGLYVFVHRLDPGSCELGPLLQVAAPQADTVLDPPGETPSRTRRRYYGLEMHPSGRFLYQTTEAWRDIRFFRVDDDGLLTFVDAYDVTRGGEHVCDHARRLEIHPDGRTLYSNCNNSGAGNGIDYALQAWRIGDDGRLTYLEHHTTAGMDAGVFDPTVHPNGRWLYQPLATRKAALSDGPGAYVLIYHVAADGRLRYHSALRVVDPDADAAYTRAGGEIDLAVSPTTVLVHPDGTHAYITVHDRVNFTHHVLAYRIDPADGMLAHVYTTDTATRGAGTHHGGVLATRGRRTFLYTFVNTRAGAGPNPRGFLEQYEIGADYRPVPLEPRVIPTGLVDARHPVVVARAPAAPVGAGRGRAGPGTAAARAAQAHGSAVSSAAVIAPVLDDGRLLLEIRPRGVGRLFFMQPYNAEPVPDLAWRNEPGPGGYVRLIEDDSVLVLEELDFDAAATDRTRSVPVATAAAALPILRRESGTGLLVVDGSDLFLDPPEGYRWAVWGVEFGSFDSSASELLRASSSDVSFTIHVAHTFAVPGDSGSMEARSVRVPIAYRVLLLPDTPARPRPCDRQIGVWHRPNPGAGDENACMIYHRPLTPADPDRTPSRPTEPIVFYIDPDTPERWLPWVMHGVEMWEPAFRAAGWHDAIQARLPPTPEEDPDFDVYDLRHSVIYWNPWDDYAWGSHWSDPRSGEILRGAGRIGGGYARSVHAKVWAEAGAAEDAARSLPVPDSLLGFELAGLVAHEVGHTLGLGHNLAASAYVPVDSLRSRSFTCSEGLAPTVMDYTPNNYVAQPGDGACTRRRRMGSWDYEVIRWLYGRTESSRTVGTASDAVGPYRWTPPGSGSAGAHPFDHRTVLHTLGDDPIRATGYGLANIGRLAGALPLYGFRDSAAAAEAMPSAAELFERLVLTWQRQLDHVVALVGDPNVEPSRQREAVRFLLEHAFVPPRFLLTDELTAVLPRPPAQVVGEAQRTLLGSLLSESRLAHLDSLERAGRTDFGTDELMAELSAGLFEPRHPASDGDGALQRALVEFFMERRRSVRPPDARSPPRSDLIQVRSDAMVSPAPDGRLLSYVDWETGDLAVRDLASGESRSLTRNPAPYENGFANSPRFSPDGERIAFTWWNAATGGAELRVVGLDPATLDPRGEPRAIRRFDDGWIEAHGWTPDGERIVGWSTTEGGGNRIVRVAADDGRIDVVRSFEWRVPLSVHAHPDGRYLAFDHQASADDFTRDIRLLDLEDDREIELVTHPANDYVLGWSPDGHHLVFASDRSGSVDVWWLPFEAGAAVGPPRLIATDIGNAAPVEVTASGQVFYAEATGGQDVFVAELDAEGRGLVKPPDAVAARGSVERSSPDWSPDGERLAWVQNVGPRPRATGHQAIAVRPLDAGETRLISLAPRLSPLRTPRWLGSDRLVLSARDERSNTVRVYALDVSTGEASVLVDPDSGIAIEEPVPGPHGLMLYYKENRERAQRIVRRDLQTGEEATLFSTAPGEGEGWRLQRLALSPGGQRLALILQRRGAAERLLVLPARGGPSVRVDGFPGGGHVTLVWSSDGRTIWFTRRADDADGGEPTWELWWIDPQSGEHAPAGLAEEGLTGLTFDPSGRRIGFSAGIRRYEVRAIPLSFGAVDRSGGRNGPR